MLLSSKRLRTALASLLLVDGRQSSRPGRMEGYWSPDSYEQSTDIVINNGYR